ncbi:MAG: serine/threonine-protein kinase, partial [Planctomycetota bacterium]
MDPDDPRLRSPHGETSQQRALFFAATVQQADDSTLQELGATLQDQGTTAQERDDTPPRLADCGPVATDSPERYRIERLLGSGGGGSVYAVHDTHLGRRVALKALRPEQAARPRHAHALSHEARLTAGLEHPNILPVHDIGRSGDGRLFFTMREAPGQDLLSLIEAARCGQVPADIADTAARVEIMLRICDAVRYAHEHGVIHRDIKPANIIIGQFGEVLLVDWGTAASRSRAAVETGLFGTPMYMAPEQARRTGADERSDIYCLGTTLFHLLTLRHPLLEGNRQRFWDKKRAGQLDQLDQDVQARLPGFLLDCVLTAVHPDPSQRYQRVADLAEDLRRYQRHQVSIERCDQAARQLSAMRVQGDHAGYTAVMATIAEARSMWPDNDQARRLELRIRWHYAHFAMQRGDLDLAAGLLLPDAAEHQDLLADLQQRRRQADARQRTARLGRAALLLLVTTVLVAGIWAWRDYQLHFGAWQLVDEWRFVPGADLEGLSLVHSGTGAEQPLAPDAQGLHPAQEHILWIDAPQRAQSLRLTATVRFPEVIDGVEFHLRSDRGPTSPWWIAGRGYLGQIGGYRNLKHLLAILEES